MDFNHPSDILYEDNIEKDLDKILTEKENEILKMNQIIEEKNKKIEDMNKQIREEKSQFSLP